jgi:uncharacterized membrane protein YqhA
MKVLERAFESLLWNSRYVVIVAVIFSLAVALGVLVLAVADALHFFGYIGGYLAGTVTVNDDFRAHMLTAVVEFVDGILFAAILFIFALGLYELFIGRINFAEGSEFAERLLLIRSIDDLKERLAKVIFLILIVKYFELAITFKVQTSQDLLFLALGIALVAAGLYLTKPKGVASDGS